MNDPIKKFIENLPSMTLHQCYIKNAARCGDNSITSEDEETRRWNQKMTERFIKLAKG